jgi:hypothetical protein
MKILITGGTNGMGKGVAGALAGMDDQRHEIILLCRSAGLGAATADELERTTGNKKISIVLCDLSRLSDVRHAVQEIQARHGYLDGLFINAGLGYAAGRVETEDGMDSHFQVNYLAQFMLTLNLLHLLENSGAGGRVIFNVTQGGKIAWDDLQMKKAWGFERGIRQAMVAKRMFLSLLHDLYRAKRDDRLSFIGFQIPKTVWSNQINIIPASMRRMAGVMKFFGTFISIEECGQIMAPLFTEDPDESRKKSGKFITRKKNRFLELKEDPAVHNLELQEKLWRISLDLCRDDATAQIAARLWRNSK